VRHAAGGRPNPAVRRAGRRQCTWPCTMTNS
jgi:hypothetical protein